MGRYREHTLCLKCKVIFVTVDIPTIEGNRRGPTTVVDDCNKHYDVGFSSRDLSNDLPPLDYDEYKAYTQNTSPIQRSDVYMLLNKENKDYWQGLEECCDTALICNPKTAEAVSQHSDHRALTTPLWYVVYTHHDEIKAKGPTVCDCAGQHCVE